MASSKYSQFQLLWVSQGCFSPLLVKEHQRKPWMLLGNQQFPPGKEVDCYLDSSNISYCLWFTSSPGTFPAKAAEKMVGKLFPWPQSHRYTALTWRYSTDCCVITPDLLPQEKAARWCWILLIVISQTGFGPEQSWSTTEVLLDYDLHITKQTGLWATFVSCYHQVLSAWLQGQVYADMARALASLPLQLPQNQEDNWDYLKLRAVRELSRLCTEVRMLVCYLPEKLCPYYSTLRALSSCMGTCGWARSRLGQAGHFCYPTSPPGNIRAHTGLRHYQNVRMTDTGIPSDTKGGQCWLCKSIRQERTGAIPSKKFEVTTFRRCPNSPVLRSRVSLLTSLRKVKCTRNSAPKASSPRN